MAKELTSANFQEKVIKGDKVTLVDFFAPWCGPCQMMGPVIDELAKDMEGKADIYKVNVDENGDLANQFQVMSIPTLVIFKEGKPVNQLVGFQSKDQIAKALEAAM